VSPPRLALALVLAGCGAPRGLEDPSDWYDTGARAEVTEAVAFTTDAYGLPAGGDASIGDALAPAFDFPKGFGTHVAPNDGPATCGWETSDSLPVTLTGVSATLPRYYFKADGCGGAPQKYYSSYWLEDDSGGVFVLGDGGVAWWDAGDTVTLRVRAATRSFGLNYVLASDVVAVDRTHRAVRYAPTSGPLGDADISAVRRVTGTVVERADTFGQIPIRPDDATDVCETHTDPGCVPITLDTEITRRGVKLEVGEHLSATGPVMFSYATYTIVVMRLGQLVRDDATGPSSESP
jgi:hypothetical protein